MQSQTIAATLPTGSFSATQSYGYDHLNRLTQATETGAAGTNWSQGYSYVGNGNRWVSSNTGNPALTLTPETPVTASAYSSSPVVNRINTWTYDNNGNIRVIPIVTNQSRSFTYDAENRAVGATITSLGTTTASYVYDALGQRVSKTVNGQTTTYVYDAFGNLTAEYGAAEASPCGTPTCYVTVDHLGSMRMLTDSNGNPQRLYDYQPFGAELPGGFWGRNTAMGYQASPDDLGPKYTGQSRDPETTLDWFQVRHMSGAQGRFQSVDPGNAGANPADPQTWNMYAYVGNNPMSSTDPSGMFADATAVGAASGGVPGAIVGGLVDLGFLLGDLPGGGGHTPALQNFPFPDQVASGGVADDTTGGSGGGGLGPFGSSFQSSGQACGDFYCNAAGQPDLLRPLPRMDAGDPAANLIIFGAGPKAASAAGGAVATLAARTTGWYLAVTGGTGIVLGRYPDYINAAKSINASVFSIHPVWYRILSATGRAWTANQQFLDTSVRRGQQIYLSNPPLGQGTSIFAQELKYLSEKGVGASNWLMLHLPFK